MQRSKWIPSPARQKCAKQNVITWSVCQLVTAHGYWMPLEFGGGREWGGIKSYSAFSQKGALLLPGDKGPTQGDLWSCSVCQL